MTHPASWRATAAFVAIPLFILLCAVPSHRALARDGDPPPLPEPTSVELGVPVYPGAKYDAALSAGYSQNETYYWFYLTADSVEQVVAFYQKQIPLPPMKAGEGYLFTIEKREGDSPYFPSRGVLVESNKLLRKTVISITKPKSGEIETGE